MIEPLLTFDFAGVAVRLLPSPFDDPDLPWVCLDDLCEACQLQDAKDSIASELKKNGKNIVLTRSLANSNVLSVPYLTSRILIGQIMEGLDVPEHVRHCAQFETALKFNAHNALALIIKDIPPVEKLDFIIAASREMRSPMDGGDDGGRESIPEPEAQPEASAIANPATDAPRIRLVHAA